MHKLYDKHILLPLPPLKKRIREIPEYYEFSKVKFQEFDLLLYVFLFIQTENAFTFPAAQQLLTPLLHIHAVKHIRTLELPFAAAVFYCWPLRSSSGAVEEFTSLVKGILKMNIGGEEAHQTG